MKLLLALLLPAWTAAQSWTPLSSGTTASLRGVSAVNAKVVWASGTGGAFLRTTDGGATWRAAQVPGAEDLDFRAVRGIDDRTAYLLSIGAGGKSRIYKTTDGGVRWTLQFTNPDAKGFLDGLAFWDAAHGIALGDPVDGQFVVLTTVDGGDHWQRRPAPPALANEGAFAASNTSLAIAGTSEAWFGTGGPAGARVFHSRDGGRTWSVASTPLRSDSASAGIFSIALSGKLHGIAVGGDYAKPAENAGNIAVTSDGGATWSAPQGAPPAGFRSAVAFLADRRAWIVTGTSGSDVSTDGGNSWRAFDSGDFNAMSFVSSAAGWAVGPRGRIARFRWK
jgi:photosystem II stability/assembly factor-like uncharacterized protein